MRTYEEIAGRIKRYEAERDAALRRISSLTTRTATRQRLWNIAERHRIRLNELYWLVGKKPIPKMI